VRHGKVGRRYGDFTCLRHFFPLPQPHKSAGPARG
jgi:hypothetical protein